MQILKVVVSIRHENRVGGFKKVVRLRVAILCDGQRPAVFCYTFTEISHIRFPLISISQIVRPTCSLFLGDDCCLSLLGLGLGCTSNIRRRKCCWDDIWLEGTSFTVR